MSADVLTDKIHRVRRRHRGVHITVAASKCVLSAIGLVAAFFLLDWLVLSASLGDSAGTDQVARGILLAAIVATFGYVFWRTLWRELVRNESDDQVALRIEKGHPELRGRLIATIQLRRELAQAPALSGSSELIHALEEDTVSFARGLTFTDIINLEVLKKVGLVALGLLLVAVGLAVWRADYSRVLLARLMLTKQEYPTTTRIVSVTPGAKVAHGEAFTVETALDPDGVVPKEATLEIEKSAAGTVTRLPMKRIDDSASFTVTIPRVLESCRYRVHANDARSRTWETLSVLERPAIKSLSIAYRFPEYAGKADEDSAVGDIRALIGTQITISATLNKPVTSARLCTRSGDTADEPAEMTLSDQGTVATGTLTVAANGSYHVALHCVDGFDGLNPIEYAVTAIKDRSPTAKITALGKLPPEDKNVTKIARWPLRFEARDDFGVARMWLKYRVVDAGKDNELGAADSAPDENDVTKVPLELDGSGAGETVFDLRELTVTEGQRVVYWVEAEDACAPTPNSGRSQRYRFTVVSAAALQEALERERKELLQRINTIRDQEKDNQSGVDNVRLKMRQNAP